MTTDDLERILSLEDSLEPSSGFALNVMDAVRRGAADPLPMRFPWFRFAAGLAGCSMMAGAGTVLLLRSETTTAMMSSLAPLAGLAPEVGYATAALLVSLGIVSLPRLLGRH
jgi:hypothetical protein